MKKADCHCPHEKNRVGRTALVLALLLLAAAAVHAVPARVALLHFYPDLGETEANILRLENLIEEAFENGANIIVTPELATSGYSTHIAPGVLRDGILITEPFADFNGIRDLAIEYEGYVVVAFPEQTLTGHLYNAQALYGPEGFITVQRKRRLAFYPLEPGNLPHEVVETPYGDLGFMICADAFLPDWVRVLSLKGADLILLPANWWNPEQQGMVEVWKTRARENSIWFMTANRWGTEAAYWGLLDINDAPSAFITPDGEVQLLYQSIYDPAPTDKILYYDVNVPEDRIGSASNPNYTLNNRRPEAYGALTNAYYRTDLGYQNPPDLPPSGTTRIASIAYQPDLVGPPSANLATVEQLWSDSGESADLVVLPGLGISTIPVNPANPAWASAAHWQALQDFVEEEGIQLLVTSAWEAGGEGGLRESLVIVRSGEIPQLRRQIHDSSDGSGSGEAPLFLDLPYARVGLLLGRDALFPEASTSLAKSGADIIVISSRVGAPSVSHDPSSSNYFWEPAHLLSMWRTRQGHVVHVAASDWTGTGLVLRDAAASVIQLETADSATPVVAIDTITNDNLYDFDSVRFKFLQAYYPFDLDALLGSP